MFSLKKTVLGLLALSSIGYAAPANDYSFSQDTIVSKHISRYPSSIGGAVGDLDSDGDLDIAVGLPSGVKIIENINRKYRDKGHIYYSGAPSPKMKVDVDIADMNNDGVLDIIYSTPSGITVLERSGEKYKKMFSAKTMLRNSYRTGIESVILDIDNDGDNDILYISGAGIEIFRSNKG